MLQSPRSIKNTKLWQKLFSTSTRPLLGLDITNDEWVGATCDKQQDQVVLPYCATHPVLLHNFSDYIIAIALPDRHFFSKTLTFSHRVTRAKTKQLLVEFLSSLQTTSNKKMSFDYQLYQQENIYHLLMVAIPLETITTVIADLQKKNCTPQIIEPKSHAIERFFLINYPELAKKTFCYIEIRSAEIEVYFITNYHTIHTYSVSTREQQELTKIINKYKLSTSHFFITGNLELLNTLKIEFERLKINIEKVQACKNIQTSLEIAQQINSYENFVISLGLAFRAL